MLTVGQVAKRLGVVNSSIRIWAKQGRFPGAEHHETPAGSYWLILESSVREFERKPVGRPPKPKPAGSGKAGKKGKKK